MAKWNLFQKCEADITFKNQYNSPQKQNEEKNYAIISINAEKAFDKIQHQANWGKKETYAYTKPCT